MLIWCCGCKQKVDARLTTGKEIYPHRPDLYSFPYWKCDDCRNYVGCHYKTKDRTRPLGMIATPEIKNARQHIHRILDPLWIGKNKSKKKRDRIYDEIKRRIGMKVPFHTANIISIEEGRRVYRVIQSIIDEIEQSKGGFFDPNWTTIQARRESKQVMEGTI